MAQKPLICNLYAVFIHFHAVKPHVAPHAAQQHFGDGKGRGGVTVGSPLATARLLVRIPLRSTAVPRREYSSPP